MGGLGAAAGSLQCGSARRGPARPGAFTLPRAHGGPRPSKSLRA